MTLGIIGPIIASALIGEERAYTFTYTVIGVIALLSVLLTFIAGLQRESVDGNRLPASALKALVL